MRESGRASECVKGQASCGGEGSGKGGRRQQDWELVPGGRTERASLTTWLATHPVAPVTTMQPSRAAAVEGRTIVARRRSAIEVRPWHGMDFNHLVLFLNTFLPSSFLLPLLLFSPFRCSFYDRRTRTIDRRIATACYFLSIRIP